MKFDQAKELADIKFRRLTGVKRTTYDKIVSILKPAHEKKKEKGGRPNTLSVEDMVLMTLEYLREYRTYFHVGQNFGVSESSAYLTIKWVENTLIKHPDFSLPGKKELLKEENKESCILIDVTESPVERPKKNKKNTTQARKDPIGCQ